MFVNDYLYTTNNDIDDDMAGSSRYAHCYTCTVVEVLSALDDSVHC